MPNPVFATVFIFLVFTSSLAQEKRMLRECDTTIKLEPSDLMVVEHNPTLDSDTLTHVPEIRSKTREFMAYEDVTYHFYIGKRGKEIKHGLSERFLIDSARFGKVLESGNYRHNKRVGRWIGFYPTGQISNEEEYRNGDLEGKITSYHPNGVILEQREMRGGRTNCKDGYFVGYHPNGQLRFEMRLKDGFVVKEVRLDSLGQPLFPAPFVHK